MAVNYDVNYEDERFTNVESDKQEALTEVEQTYGNMIDQSDSFYQAQIDASKQWADKQSQLQQEQTDFTIEQIEQQKQQAEKDYTKEQSGAYVDWQKQSNQYGANAEKMASAGMTGTGYSESSQVSMYNTYQNRVTTARESFQRAILNYDNNIKEARLQNNSILAEIAFEAQNKQLELALSGFQYKNQLILDQANKKLEVENLYYQRWQDVLNQINTENALAEDVRQFDENIKFQTEQKELDRKFEEKQAEIERKFKADQAELDRAYDSKQKELDRKHDKEMLEAKNEQERKMLEQKHKNDLEVLAKQHENDLAVLEKEKQNEMAIYKYQLEQKNKTSGSSGNGTSTKPKGNNAIINKDQTTQEQYDPKIDWSSVEALGLGKLTEERLASLEANGVIQRYVKNGRYYFKRTATTSKLMALYKD